MHLPKKLATAHPRSRGENSYHCAAAGRVPGSSPLTRGKPASAALRARGWRLIPAHAGKTGGGVAEHEHGGAHPRSRGENTRPVPLLVPGRGSSPLTRGKRNRYGPRCDRPRLIPAHAGKTRCRSSAHAAASAHPRSRGENHATMLRCAMRAGSSPLTRGKRRNRPRPRCEVRLIPAHAGKTPNQNTRKKICRAHPRSRGENVNFALSGACSRGSSPLTRGKQRDTRGDDDQLRLIPAHAGKTSRYGNTSDHHQAHPRSRGENRRQPRSQWTAWGSSPLTRGKHAVATASS